MRSLDETSNGIEKERLWGNITPGLFLLHKIERSNFENWVKKVSFR